jgi:hypothetical protein
VLDRFIAFQVSKLEMAISECEVKHFEHLRGPREPLPWLRQKPEKPFCAHSLNPFWSASFSARHKIQGAAQAVGAPNANFKKPIRVL